ncbi:MAG: peptidoglycan-binding domain-containing protein [Polyangiaceae bacterium]
MPTHVVAQGDCIASIADRYGFHDPAALFDHADNAALKALRKLGSVLLPGDRVVIPERAEKWQESCATGKVHSFTLKRPVVHLRVLVRWTNGDPIAGKRYVLKVEGRPDVEGTTGSDGLVEAEVPAAALRGEIHVHWDGADVNWPLVLPVHIGHLDPLDTPTGVQGRLANLGYGCEITGELADTRDALAAFQREEGLEPTGELDDKTRDALRSRHEGF